MNTSIDKELRKYVTEKLGNELIEVRRSNRSKHHKELSNYEKAIIYHYTDNGYEDLNEALRGGKDIPKLGEYLNHSLNRLDNFKSLCYRSIKCKNSDLERYYIALKNKTTIIEKFFLSCSKSRIIVGQFSKSPLFIIVSKHGKDIEKIAKFGIDSFGQNEKEILFKSNSKFKVLKIEEVDEQIILYLEEV